MISQAKTLSKPCEHPASYNPLLVASILNLSSSLESGQVKFRPAPIKMECQMHEFDSEDRNSDEHDSEDTLEE